MPDDQLHTRALQRPGSILIFPFYISDPSNPNTQNTRTSITNIDTTRPAFLHMFFIDGSTCSVADNFLCDFTGNASTIGSLFGLLYNDAEIAYSFSVTQGTCQLRTALSGTFPRTAPRFPEVVPAGRSGWIKLWLNTPGNEGGLVGATINANTNPNGYRGGHNLHKVTLGTASLTIPVFAPSCQ